MSKRTLQSRLWKLIVAMGALVAFAQSPSDTMASHDITRSKIVLIARGDSYLENAVAKIIVDTLSRRGISVTTSDLKGLNAKVVTDFSVVLIFNAVKSSQVSGQVKNLVPGMRDPGGNSQSNIMICTVYGDLWNPKNAAVDAITGPTRSLNPGMVANKILKHIGIALDGNQGGGY